MKYWAFISYSHRDKAWGEWLHKALETYRVPPRFVGKDNGHGAIPKRLHPMFRDKDELASSADLGRIINEALEQSRSLIVICSPAAAQSRWVNEEVLAFKRLGRADRIFALIVEGEPEQSFPQVLKFHLNPDGTISGRPAEPIAADARKGQDTKADAKLRMLAGLMGVPYDELKQRERHRKKRRFLIALAATVIISSVVGIFAHRFLKTHHELTASAPAYYNAAIALIDEGNLELALEKISYAVSLAPAESKYHVVRGNVLQSLLKLGDAADSYRRALQIDPHVAGAADNLKLCQEILGRMKAGEPVPQDAILQLQVAMEKQGRTAEARAIVLAAGKGRPGFSAVWDAAFKREGLAQVLAGSSRRLTMRKDGAMQLDLSNTEISDLSSLIGMPIAVLNLRHTPVADLGPLHGMSIEVLNVGATKVVDLGPLKGLPLRDLRAYDTAVSDITPLEGMPLNHLDLNRTQVTNLNVLRGMPLQRLHLFKCQNLRDVSPLADCKDLEILLLPPHAENIDFLRNHPKLTRLSYKKDAGIVPAPAQTVKEFWLERDGLGSDAAGTSLDLSGTDAVDLSGLQGKSLTRLNLAGTRVTDLSPLANMPLEELNISNTWVTNLKPIEAMPLKALVLSDTPVADIAPLKGMPLRRLNLSNCINIRNISFLSECVELVALVLPPNAENIDFLRKLPNLERVSYAVTKQGTEWTPKQTTVKFWKTYDARETSHMSDVRDQKSVPSSEPGKSVSGGPKADGTNASDVE